MHFYFPSSHHFSSQHSSFMLWFASRYNPLHPNEAAAMCLKALIHDLRPRPVEPPAQTFTLFSQLPPEIHLLIWEAALPPQHQDMHTGYNIWLSDFTKMKNCRLPGKLEAPTGLLRACSESRAVGLATGSFLERRYKLWLNIRLLDPEPIWIDNRIKTLMMPINIKALEELPAFPQSLQSVATLAATKECLKSILLFLESSRRSHNIRTILDGLMWLPLRYGEGSNTETRPCVNLDTAVVPLDDPKMLDYLTSAFECHGLTTLNERIDPACHRKSARNFLVFNKFLMSTIYSSEHYDIPNGFELKPAITFGRPHLSGVECLEWCIRVMDTFVCRSEDDEDLKQWHDGTTFGTNSDVFRYRTLPYEQKIRDLIGQ